MPTLTEAILNKLDQHEIPHNRIHVVEFRDSTGEMQSIVPSVFEQVASRVQVADVPVSVRERIYLLVKKNGRELVIGWRDGDFAIIRGDDPALVPFELTAAMLRGA